MKHENYHLSACRWPWTACSSATTPFAKEALWKWWNFLLIDAISTATLMPPERTCDWAVHISDLPLACVHEYWLMAITELRSRVFLIEGASYWVRTFAGRLDVPSREFTRRVNGTNSMFDSSKRPPLGRHSCAAHIEYSETRRCCREL